jgi:glutamine amidotransferase
MCRHLAYLGPPIPLSRLLFDPPHALSRQSWAPRDMRGGGTINADGFGVGWYAPAPVRYRRRTPLWSDPDLPGLAAAVPAGAVLAAVRSATAGMPVVETAAAPFAGGRWLFSHNGVVAGWPGTVAGAAAAEAVRDTVAEVERAAPGSRLNLLLVDGTSLVATAAGHALSVRRDTTSVLVSSEPLDDDPAWRPVPDRTLLTATATDLALTTLGAP